MSGAGIGRKEAEALVGTREERPGAEEAEASGTLAVGGGEAVMGGCMEDVVPRNTFPHRGLVAGAVTGTERIVRL